MHHLKKQRFIFMWRFSHRFTQIFSRYFLHHLNIVSLLESLIHFLPISLTFSLVLLSTFSADESFSTPFQMLIQLTLCESDEKTMMMMTVTKGKNKDIFNLKFLLHFLGKPAAQHFTILTSKAGVENKTQKKTKNVWRVVHFTVACLYILRVAWGCGLHQLKMAKEFSS